MWQSDFKIFISANPCFVLPNVSVRCRAPAHCPTPCTARWARRRLPGVGKAKKYTQSKPRGPFRPGRDETERASLTSILVLVFCSKLWRRATETRAHTGRTTLTHTHPVPAHTNQFPFLRHSIIFQTFTLELITQPRKNNTAEF